VKTEVMTKLRELSKRAPSPNREPLWKGPTVDGITYSMFSRFIVCRERFRVKYVLGMQPAEHFNPRTGYGDMWHVCEEAHAAGKSWVGPLAEHGTGLRLRFPLQHEEIDKWTQVCATQFPCYVEHWRKNPDVLKRTPLMQEEVFDVPYKLPSGRVVRLRGKWDSVDVIGDGIYLQENKTKSDVEEAQLRRQLSFDLQTMMYIVSLQIAQANLRANDSRGKGIKGVRYNVVRRPLAGGKGSIRPHIARKNKPAESMPEFYARLRDEVIMGDPGPSHFFMRLKCEVSQQEIDKFRCECLDPILENLCWWYDVNITKQLPENVARRYGVPPSHWRHPFGVYNVLDEGGSSEYDDFLATGNDAGMRYDVKLFKELVP
jgi:hypothetical protein